MSIITGQKNLLNFHFVLDKGYSLFCVKVVKDENTVTMRCEAPLDEL
jgi:hypothetical protein